MNKVEQKRQNIKRRKARIRAKIFGDASRPRLCVFKSNKNIYLQLIDDIEQKTLLSATSLNEENSKANMSETSYNLGKQIAEKAMKKGIKQAVFDRGEFPYLGNVAKVAEGARETGLKI